jgi:hypothetical protein
MDAFLWSICAVYVLTQMFFRFQICHTGHTSDVKTLIIPGVFVVRILDAPIIRAGFISAAFHTWYYLRLNALCLSVGTELSRPYLCSVSNEFGSRSHSEDME